MVLVAGGVLADLTYTATTELLTEAGWRLAAPLPAPAIMPGLGLGNRVLLLGNSYILTPVHCTAPPRRL